MFLRHRTLTNGHRSKLTYPKNEWTFNFCVGNKYFECTQHTFRNIHSNLNLPWENRTKIQQIRCLTIRIDPEPALGIWLTHATKIGGRTRRRGGEMGRAFLFPSQLGLGCLGSVVSSPSGAENGFGSFCSYQKVTEGYDFADIELQPFSIKRKKISKHFIR